MSSNLAVDDLTTIRSPPSVRSMNSALANTALRVAHLLLLVAALALLPGCGGCDWGNAKTLTPEEREEAKKKTTQDKPDFGVPTISALPDPTRCSLKPGHWVEISQQLKPNNFNFDGDAICSTVTAKNQDFMLERSAFVAKSSRRAALIKGQTKEIDLSVYVARPPLIDGALPPIRLRPMLRSRNSARMFEFGAMPTTLMRSYQFHFIILAKNPDKYGFIRSTSCVAPPTDDWSMADIPRANYIISTPNLKERATLPHSAMTWTTTAYILWDDVDPDALSFDQQTAMLDWLHWGGQLIVSGPQSIEQLRLGFLSDYLPATPGPMVNADHARLEQLDETWSLEPRKPRPGGQYLLSENQKPLQIIELNLHPSARFVPNTADLVAERRLGRGRIVVTAFGLADQAMVQWRSFDSFLNGCLLNRPPRRFSKGRDGFAVFSWDNILGKVLDPRISSQLRYFTRDAAIDGLRQDSDGRALVVKPLPNDATLGMSAAGEISKPRDGFAPEKQCGVAAWNDFSSAAVAARSSLVESAGVSVPNSKFVAKLLAAYLFFLVPVNWLIFRSTQRVEWAWFAAPVIAVVGALAVIRLAQLDIGFVRSRTEIAVVETQGSYDRAHLTRYTGLYTSLSTTYALEFDDATAVALPFSTDPSNDELRLATTQNVQFRQQKHASLQGMPILSNSTGLVHSEQMIDLDGPILLSTDGGAPVIENGTTWKLQSAILVRRVKNTFQLALLGTIDPGSITPAEDRPASADEFHRFLESSPVTSYSSPKGQVSLRQLYRLALDARQLADGGARLVAWTDVDLKGVKIRPRSNQRTHRVLVVSNLDAGIDHTAGPDANLYEDVKEKQSDLFDPPEGL
jgi:hypothetical protein